jgi:hypothetical protein
MDNEQDRMIYTVVYYIIIWRRYIFNIPIIWWGAIEGANILILCLVIGTIYGVCDWLRGRDH